MYVHTLVEHLPKNQHNLLLKTLCLHFSDDKICDVTFIYIVTGCTRVSRLSATSV